MRRVSAIAVASWLVACGGASSNRPISEFLPGDERLFDDGIDLVSAPAIVEGEWSGEFERRVDRADLIAAIKIESLASDVDLDRRSSYRLHASVAGALKGKGVSELILRVHDDQAGFDSVRKNEDRLLRDPWVVFVKWQVDEASGQVQPRWHLSPGSDQVVKKVMFLMRPPPGEAKTEVEVIAP